MLFEQVTDKTMTNSLDSSRKIIVPLLRDCDRPMEVSALMDDASILIEAYANQIAKATAYLHGLLVFSSDTKYSEINEAIKILEGNL